MRERGEGYKECGAWVRGSEITTLPEFFEAYDNFEEVLIHNSKFPNFQWIKINLSSARWMDSFHCWFLTFCCNLKIWDVQFDQNTSWISIHDSWFWEVGSPLVFVCVCVPERDREGRLLIYALLAEAKRNEGHCAHPAAPLHDSHEHTSKFGFMVGWVGSLKAYDNILVMCPTKKSQKYQQPRSWWNKTHRHLQWGIFTRLVASVTIRRPQRGLALSSKRR